MLLALFSVCVSCCVVAGCYSEVMSITSAEKHCNVSLSGHVFGEMWLQERMELTHRKRCLLHQRLNRLYSKLRLPLKRPSPLTKCWSCDPHIPNPYLARCSALGTPHRGFRVRHRCKDLKRCHVTFRSKVTLEPWTWRSLKTRVNGYHYVASRRQV
jgi:hypothetical protein